MKIRDLLKPRGWLLAFLGAAVLLAGCAPRPLPAPPAAGGDGPLRIAVLPFENLSAASAPLAEMRNDLAGRLRRQGIGMVEESALTDFIARHRLRHTGGLDRETADAFAAELGVSAILVTSLAQYQEGEPPKISLFCRLVQTAGEPSVLWMDGIGLAGDQSQGLLETGLVRDITVLREQALKRLGDSLVRFAAGAGEKAGGAGFAPSVYFRSPILDSPPPHRVAILPFVNQSERRFGGDLLALHFARELVKTGKFTVVEPGLVREGVNRNRVIIPEGASLDIAGLLVEALDADLLVSGKVMEYHDDRGAGGAPLVDFNVEVIERKSGQVVWSSQSRRAGDQGVFFFSLGRVATAHELASRMVRGIAESIASAEPGPEDGIPAAAGSYK